MVRPLLIAAATLFSFGPAVAANYCSAPPLSCATTMPVGGYCECTSKGQTIDGTVMERQASKKRVNSTSGGCGAQPNSPGCR